MIHEVDEALRSLLGEAGLPERGVEVVFDAPTRDLAARRTAPTVSVFLYGLREETGRRQAGAVAEYDEDGVVVGHRPAPRWFELGYLVTVWTNRPQDEHRLLAEVLQCLTAVDALPARLLTGSLARLGLTVGLDIAGRDTGLPSVSDVWSALGGELRPSIDLRVLAPLPGGLAPAGPPVTEGLVVRATDTTRESEPGGRRLRYHGAGDPGTDGFAAPRERVLPPGRRTRGRAR
ncbi:DUF4255 domain-containing protein [Kitasatospora aureofaciens]|uniref:Pvc16 N-terminal domain-containing protein n=1 Tax=Kitasatospora aureofaciens TaxID=1894 RepID=A0A1E7MVV9_KITAU|nr:DUF4255 domain-containing protein [Kitasatospora aureofaciens]QEU98407.1 DUF4255 domain-containing protein [Streptomyces viridifaciens]OEV32559.1 hypothetical protein HS99_0040135 [Kitasatospora aureofaciens]UKZ04335.1 DUF4255 domain-containing protein [Streptomyces viridifaciens]GGV06737.1 hypothetical protein GCM10010502_72180 [Kitasatospora aureofaciens]HJD82690.1 DUF4255 domain-containing protein [Kitasatospora aureofaciens]